MKMTPVEISAEIKKLSPEELMELFTIMVNHFVTMTAELGPEFRKEAMDYAMPMILESIK